MLRACAVLTSNFAAPPTTDVAVPLDEFSALFEIPQIDLLQSALPAFNADWTEYLNLEPDPSIFLSSPPLVPPFVEIPSLVDDAILSLPCAGDPPSPEPPSDILPHLSEKSVRLPIVGEPIIRGQDFLFPPGEEAGIPSSAALLFAH